MQYYQAENVQIADRILPWSSLTYAHRYRFSLESITKTKMFLPVTLLIKYKAFEWVRPGGHNVYQPDDVDVLTRFWEQLSFRGTSEFLLLVKVSNTAVQLQSNADVTIELDFGF